MRNNGCRGGVLISQDPASDKKTEQRLLRCIHCQHVWAERKGSGRLRGWCGRCAGDVCGRPACVAQGCLHWEKELELLERGVRPEDAPVSASVGGVLLG